MEYDKREAEILIQWFRDNWNRLPKELQINGCTRTSNLRYTVEKTVKAIKATIGNPDVCIGYINTLYDIKKKLS